MEIATSSGTASAEAAPRPLRERLSIVIGGHVDHGKSTVVGRLLADSGALPEGKLEQVRAACERNAKPFEYAFLLDALKDEQAQGITIDAARVFFKTAKRDYVIVDAPGHVEFLKNLVTGAARAEAAFLVIDAKEGTQENSRRHGLLMSMLGLRQVAVVVNKMDLVGHAKPAFDAIVRDYDAFLRKLDLTPTGYIPVAARDGANVARRAADVMPWYDGPTVLQALEGFAPERPPVEKPFRMPVQDVYKFTKQGDDRRIVAGTVESGAIRPGDEVVFYPSGKKSRVKTIEAFNRPAPAEAAAGEATGFTLREQIYVGRGEIACLAGEPRPHVTTRLRVSLFWLGKSPLVPQKDYILKLGSARVPARVEEIQRVIDASTLSEIEGRSAVERHEAADCRIKLGRAIAFDTADAIAATGRFVLVDEHEIRGGGLVREALPDKQAWVRDKVLLRNYKWEASMISSERRAEKYSQKSMLVLVTGDKEGDRKRLAKDLETRLFEDGKVVYYLGIGNVLYGVDADIERNRENRAEHMRRLAEVANILLDAGVILIVTAAELTQDDVDLIATTVDPEKIETVWAGDRVTTDLEPGLQFPPQDGFDEAVERVKALLQDRGVIFRPW